MIGRDDILALIPHAGRMCLLDAVERWDDDSLVCSSRSHLQPDNPLRLEGQLSAIHLVEYGAQAMAVHGGLLARARGEVAGPGMLAGIRGLQLWAQRLDRLGEPLAVVAHKRLANASGWLYDFEVACGDRRLAAGRLSVMSGAGLPPSRTEARP